MDVNDYTKVIFNIITFALIMNTNSSNFTIANHLFLTLFKVFTILRCIDNTFNPINGNIKTNLLSLPGLFHHNIAGCFFNLQSGKFIIFLLHGTSIISSLVFYNLILFQDVNILFFLLLCKFKDQFSNSLFESQKFILFHFI